MSTVGIIVNPHAGKDIRRLSTPATHTSDVTKVGIVQRAIVAALETGVDRVLLMPDGHRLGARAAQGLGSRVAFIDQQLSGSRWDTVAAARHLFAENVGAVIVLGGDGTARDVALGWPEVPLVAISTGTNNIFPSAFDGTSAGVACALVARNLVDLDLVGRRSKRIVVRIEDHEGLHEDLALVELAVVSGQFTGARAVQDPRTLREVIAAIATPVGSGLSGIAGRIHPVLRHQPGGVRVTMGSPGTQVRVPLAPGAFTTVTVADVQQLADEEPLTIAGGHILAFDGERDRVTRSDSRITAHIDWRGPCLIDVEKTLVIAAERGLFTNPPCRTNDDCPTAKNDHHAVASPTRSKLRSSSGH